MKELPELDAIKMDGAFLLGRIKNTEVWIEIDVFCECLLDNAQSQHLLSIILAWKEFKQQLSQ